MKIYLVENGHWNSGYFLNRNNAEKEVLRVNSLIEEYKDNPRIDKNKYFVTEIETED